MRNGHVAQVLARLRQGGYSAYLVGGCLRDLLRGAEPHDWDIATSARPEQTMALFGRCALPTGIQHGTVTVQLERESIEVTTFRCDGPYLDGRHPSSVSFTSSIEEDLARRDFTVNAMAMDEEGKLIDPFGGQKDLKAGLIRCVGEPEKRFAEDALRILRALRFSACLGFAIAPDTETAIDRQANLLHKIAAERIREEMDKLLCGGSCLSVLLRWPQVLGVFLPELTACVGFDQRNRHHCYTVYEHICRSVAAAPAEPLLRWVMLLHDVGKPETFTLGADGQGHFRDHDQRSADMAAEIFMRLRFDRATARQAEELIRWHDRDVPRTEAGISRALSQLGREQFFRLLAVKRADNLAQHPDYRRMQQEIDRAEVLARNLLARGQCLSVRELSVNGRDLLALGYRGAEIGQAQQRLLSLVLDQALPNSREALLDYLKENRM